jgi:hypothetical protein
MPQMTVEWKCVSISHYSVSVWTVGSHHVLLQMREITVVTYISLSMVFGDKALKNRLCMNGTTDVKMIKDQYKI